MTNMSKFDSYSKVLRWFIALTLSALAAGCGGGGGRDPILGTGDVGANTGVAPLVTFVTPLPNATAVPTNTKIITAAFTKAMDPATLTAATFTLACPAGTTQSGTVAYLPSGSVATLTLAANLPANTTCTATITTGAKDTSGVPLASAFTWTFATGATTDAIAPMVSSIVPLIGATGVSINGTCVAIFSEAMDPTTITATNFTMTGPGGTAVAGTVSYLGTTATFKPTAAVAANTAYTCTVTTGVKDLASNPMAANFAWGWTTAATADATAPTVTGTINLLGAINVPVNTKVGATFSEAMDPLTITTATFTLQHTLSGAYIPGVVSYAGVNAVFIPLQNLNLNTTYTAKIIGGAGGVKDLAGNALGSPNTPEGDYAWSWVTGPSADTTAPTVTGAIPLSRQVGVAVNTRASVTFSEAMDPLTITNLNVRLQETATGATVPGILSYSGVTATIIPLSNLKPNTNYTTTVFGNVADLAGNVMNSTFQIGWTTGATPDTTAPTVTGAIPASLQTNVGINSRANVTFSEAMDPLTITNLNVRLQETATGAAVPGTLSYAGVTATIIPSSNLKPNTNYTTTVFGNVKDLAGNVMNSTFQIGWTTGATPDTTAPTVVSSLQNNGQLNVPINTKVGVTFSEAMDPLTITNLNVRLRETATGVAVPSTLSYSGVSALIVPLSNLKPNTNYTTTVLGNVADLAGNLMNNTFEIGWTTAAVADVTAPTVTLVSPADLETNVALNKAPYAFFSEWMDPLTVTTATFTLAGPGGTPVVGTVLNGTSFPNALFTPLTNLAPATLYTATIKGGIGGVTDVAGNAMAADKVWTFTTGAVVETGVPPIPPRVGPAPIVLNSILTNNFVILTTTGITNTGSHSSAVTGNVGSSPITAAAMSTLWCPELTGLMYGVDAAYNPVGSGITTCFRGNPSVPAVVPPDANKTLVDIAVGDMGIAYGDALGRPHGAGATNLNVGAGTLAANNFAPGTYTWDTPGDVIITGDITLTGTANDTWLFQMTGDLTVASGKKVVLAGGALAKNVFWQIGGPNGATLNTGATLNGVVLTAKQVIFRTGATLNGRALSGTQTVLDASTVGP